MTECLDFLDLTDIWIFQRCETVVSSSLCDEVTVGESGRCMCAASRRTRAPSLSHDESSNQAL